MITSVGQLLINETLPEDLRDYSRVLDKKSIKALFHDIAVKYPDQYKDIAAKLISIAGESATRTGASLSLDDLKAPPERAELIAKLKADVAKLASNTKLPRQERNKRIAESILKNSAKIQSTVYDAAVKSGNRLAQHVASGSRGNAGQFNSIVGALGPVSGPGGHTLPIPVTRSFSEGLSPAEYWATTYGARKGLVAVKFATRDAGYLCLDEDTEVRMADFSTKKIKDIIVGDYVLGADKSGNTFKSEVTSVFNNGEKEVFSFRFYSARHNLEIRATKEHKVLAKTGENIEITPLGDIAEHSHITEHSEYKLLVAYYSDFPNFFEGKFQRYSLVGIRKTFDIEVNNEDHLFVLANGAIVSNSKQFNQAVHRLVVTEEDCETANGVEITPDSENIGSVLARDTSLYPKGTVLTPKKLKDLKSSGEKVYVRSVMTCQSHAGVCSKCSGVRSSGHFPAIGDNIGIPASSALSEKLTQGSISAKHTAAGAQKVSGFDYINQLVQVPKVYAGGSAHADIDGFVTNIEKAPQGGHFIYIGDHEHYSPKDQDLLVKVGDEIEAGDMLSDGVPNPGEIVRHKGIGEGRKYLSELLKRAYEEGGMSANRRNTEVVARALINHVVINQPNDTYTALPGDVVEYDAMARNYTPREGSENLSLSKAAGKYLESPVLHYSIGTRITPRVVKTLKDAKINNVLAHTSEPGFEPEQQRASESLALRPDWLQQMAGSHLKANLLKSVQTGTSSDLKDVSFIPKLITGTF